MLASIGLLVGIVLGLLLPISLPANTAGYVLITLLVLLTKLVSFARVKGEPKSAGLLVAIDVGCMLGAVFLIQFLGNRLGIATQQPLLVVLLLRLVAEIASASAALCDFVAKRFGPTEHKTR